MRRREFIKLVGGVAAVLPSSAIWAQQQLPLVGFLNSASPDTYRFNAHSFGEGLTKGRIYRRQEMFVLKNGGPRGTTRHCRPLPLSS